MPKSVCPLCSSSDGFPQTMADQKIVGNLFVTGSYTIETQYVFCKECRVQFEPLITWREFNIQKKKQAAARQVASLSPGKRAAHDARENLKKIKHKRSMAWQWFGAALIFPLPLGVVYYIAISQFPFFIPLIYVPASLILANTLKKLNAREEELLAILGKSKPN